MVTLALDTSTRSGAVAIGVDAKVLAESVFRVRATHSEVVLPEIDRMLGSCDLTAADIGSVVVGGGPGSFTGVRIAAALAKGICSARGLELYSYSSLAAVAAGAGHEGAVCAMFDARRGQVYAAGYRIGSGVEELFPPRAQRLADLLEELVPLDEWVFTGDGAQAGARSIEALGGRILDPETSVPGGRALLWLRSVDPAGGRVADPGSWEPGYVRLPAAQRGPGG